MLAAAGDDFGSPAGARGRTVDVLDVMDACRKAFASLDWERLRALVHPDALVETTASGGQALGRDAAISALRSATSNPVYDATARDVSRWDRFTALVSGAARVPLEHGGFVDTQRLWLCTQLDGRLYRSVLVANEESGRLLYGEHGITLGLGDGTMAMAAEA